MRKPLPPVAEPQESRIHNAYLEACGTAPNVVQARAVTRYAIRSTTLSGMRALNERVQAIARGAALMTGTKVDISIMSEEANMQGNTPLEEAMQQAMDRLGGVPFDDTDRAYAARIQATLSDEDIDAEYRQNGLLARKGSPLRDYVVPADSRGPAMMGSTDVADVSWAVPTVQARVATHAIGTPDHSWQITAQGKAGAAHKGMIHDGGHGAHVDGQQGPARTGQTGPPPPHGSRALCLSDPGGRDPAADPFPQPDVPLAVDRGAGVELWRVGAGFRGGLADDLAVGLAEYGRLGARLRGTANHDILAFGGRLCR